MGKKKTVFFDIDGTLWDFQNRIPESAVRAVRALRANGHLALLCSGRTRGFIRDPALLGIGFDGIVSGCGTLIEYGGETLFYHRIGSELAQRAVQTARTFGFRVILEGREYLYFDREDFEGDAYGEKLRRDLGEGLRGITENWGGWEFSKFSCDTRDCDQAAGLAALAPEFDPIIHNENVVEMVPAGFDKGSGIRRLCGLIGRDPADTVAFGDSVNDLGMFAVCGVSVAMGNASAAAKAAADIITTSLTEDGVWHGCKALGLI